VAFFPVASAATIAKGKEAICDEATAVVAGSILLPVASSADARAADSDDDTLLLNIEEVKVGRSRSKDIAVITATE
jgi:hypothetical protein